MIPATGPTATVPTATGSPATPGFASVHDARLEYLRLLEPSGRSAQTLDRLLDGPNARVADVQQAAEEYARATEQFALALKQRSWPEQVAPAVEELTAQLLAQVEPTRAAARGTSIDEIASRLRQVPAATAAERVRSAFEQAGA